MAPHHPRCHAVHTALAAVTLAVPASTALAAAAFNFNPITDTILSAQFNADVAGLTAHRTFLGEQVNSLSLLDVSGVNPDLDLSDLLFGNANWPNPTTIDLGPQDTAIVSAPIDPSFFPVLATGKVGLDALFTDTGDALFAIDYLSITIQTTARSTIESLYGAPVGNENDGYGLGVPDGDPLPAPMPGALDPTGTGFDEEISSKAIFIPVPPIALSLILGACAFSGRSRRP